MMLYFVLSNENMVVLLIFNNSFIFNTSFWDANIKSILLTDTCYQRDPLYTCKTSVWCDNSAKASLNDILGFAYSTATAAKNLTKYYACTDRGIVSQLMTIHL